MSFVISANRLFMLTQSRRLHSLLQGKFSVEVLASPRTTPQYFDLSFETIEVALNAALAGTILLSPDKNQDRVSFINELLEDLDDFDQVRWKTTVHAELALIMAMVNGDIKGVEPYIGVSKLSCTMCSHYIRAFNRHMGQKIGTKGSHGKAYPGWFWPSLPDHDEELRPTFLRLIREQLRSDFERYAEKARRLSDSSVGSGYPGLDISDDDDRISKHLEVRTGSRHVVFPVNDLPLGS